MPTEYTNIEKRIETLKKVSFLEGTDESILTTIAKVVDELHITAGDAVFLKGDLDKAMYIIVEGQVKVHDGGHVFNILNVNDFFGEYSLIDTSERTASVSAIKNTILLKISESVFYGFIREQNRLIQGVVKSLINRVRDKDLLEEKLAKRNEEIRAQRDEIIKQNEILEIQRKELEELNKTKDKFFSIISHDLRGPFSVILGYTDLLLKQFEKFTKEQTLDFVTQIQNSARKQYKLLENLLQWSRIQIGTMKCEPTELNLKNLNSNVLTLFEPNARNKEINLFSQIGDVKVLADENMITAVMRNLVSNAIKFTPRGGYVNIYTKNTNKFIEITVQDSGIGISEKKIKNLFNIEVSNSTPGTEEESGTGLGLILCKEFVEKNGGKIWAESQINEGTEMKFTLPAYEQCQ